MIGRRPEQGREKFSARSQERDMLGIWCYLRFSDKL